MHHASRFAVVAAVCIVVATVAPAQEHVVSRRDVECFLLGNEFAVASEGRWISNSPIHFHSNDTMEDPATTTDFAEVGECCAGLDFEEVRGLAEFDVSGMESEQSVTLVFQVIELGGLMMQFPPAFEVQAVTYIGNNTEQLMDYTAATTYSLGTFATSGLSVDEWIELDITDAFNDALRSPSLGVRLQANSEPNGGAIVFGNFEICRPAQEIFADGFESGDTTGWSASVP